MLSDSGTDEILSFIHTISSVWNVHLSFFFFLFTSSCSGLNPNLRNSTPTLSLIIHPSPAFLRCWMWHVSDNCTYATNVLLCLSSIFEGLWFTKPILSQVGWYPPLGWSVMRWTPACAYICMDGRGHGAGRQKRGEGGGGRIGGGGWGEEESKSLFFYWGGRIDIQITVGRDKLVGVTWTLKLRESFTLVPCFLCKTQNEVVFWVEKL